MGMSAIMERYIVSSHCLFFLDYDGTLAELQKAPENAHLTLAEHTVLRDLCQKPQNTIVIISGRDRPTLDVWLAGLSLNIAAEYGHFIKESGSDWQVHADRDPKWKKAIRPVMETVCEIVPGSLVEDKDFSLVWHYRQATTSAGEAAAKTLVKQLEPLATELRLTITAANKVVEVMVPGVDKAGVARHWLKKRDWDFILAAGDSLLDEDLFHAMPKGAFTVKIGSGATGAQERLANPHELSGLLNTLNDLCQT